MNSELEKALHYAAQAGDIKSLVALARQESRRADEITSLLNAVIAVTGPVEVSNIIAASARPAYIITVKADSMVISANL